MNFDRVVEELKEYLSTPSVIVAHIAHGQYINKSLANIRNVLESGEYTLCIERAVCVAEAIGYAMNEYGDPQLTAEYVDGEFVDDALCPIERLPLAYRELSAAILAAVPEATEFTLHVRDLLYPEYSFKVVRKVTPELKVLLEEDAARRVELYIRGRERVRMLNEAEAELRHYAVAEEAPLFRAAHPAHP